MHSHKRGFTLIELLVVIAIIGILSSVVLASLNGARRKGRDARRIADVKQIQLALEMYYDNISPPEYPDALADLSPASGTKYIPSVPVDPQTGSAYSYDNITTANAVCTRATGVCASYVLGTVLEDLSNPAISSGIAAGTYGAVTCSPTSTTNPNYCVSP